MAVRRDAKHDAARTGLDLVGRGIDLVGRGIDLVGRGIDLVRKARGDPDALADRVVTAEAKRSVGLFRQLASHRVTAALLVEIQAWGIHLVGDQPAPEDGTAELNGGKHPLYGILGRSTVFAQPLLGKVSGERLELVRGADWVGMDEIKAAGLYRQVWQSFAVLTPLRTVGVMGDFRTYGHMVAVRIVSSSDGMTADWARVPYDLLARISNRIVNEVPGVNRVTFDITSKPPGTIEWE